MEPPALYLAILKIAVAPMIAFIIAVFGWVFTAMHTDSQQKIARERNQADIEIARTNAAMGFLQYLENIPETKTEKRSHAITLAVPVLPVDFAFDLALDNIEHDTGAIAALIQRSNGRHWTVLESRIGRGPYFETAEFVQDIRFDDTTSEILRFLYSRNLNGGIENYLFKTNPSDISLRANAIVNYFRFLRRRSDQTKQEALAFVRHSQLVNSILIDDAISNDIKRAVAFAGCISFLNGYGDDRDAPLLEHAARYFWSGLAVSQGEIPREDSLRGYLYRHAFHHGGNGVSVRGLSVLSSVSDSLMGRIRSIPSFHSLSWDQVRLMLYSYVQHTPRDTESPFVSFLDPDDAFSFWEKILDWADTPERRRQLGRVTNSLGGHAIFRNIGRSKTHQRRWAESTVSFYEQHYSQDWYPAKIMHVIAHRYPEFRQRIKSNEWGISLE